MWPLESQWWVPFFTMPRSFDCSVLQRIAWCWGYIPVLEQPGLELEVYIRESRKISFGFMQLQHKPHFIWRWTVVVSTLWAVYLHSAHHPSSLYENHISKMSFVSLKHKDKEVALPRGLVKYEFYRIFSTYSQKWNPISETLRFLHKGLGQQTRSCK
jgi:hypothetical protein